MELIHYTEGSMKTIEIKAVCPTCHEDRTIRYGIAGSGNQRHLCLNCLTPTGRPKTFTEQTIAPKTPKMKLNACLSLNVADAEWLLGQPIGVAPTIRRLIEGRDRIFATGTDAGTYQVGGGGDD